MDIDSFSTKDFSLSYHGIDIFKNGILHKHIDFREINFVEIKKDLITKRWFVVTILGVVISLLFLWLIINNTPKNIPASGMGRGILLIYISYYFSFFFGLTLIIASITKGTVLKIVLTNNHVLKYSLKQLTKEKKLHPLINFLNSRVKMIVSTPVIKDSTK